MASFTISTLAGRVLAEVPLDDAALQMVAGDLLGRVPPADITGKPRLLLGVRELGWCERLADLTLAPGAVVALVLLPYPVEEALADLLSTEASPVRLAAARALRATGAAAAAAEQAAEQVEEAATAVLSDPDAEVAGEALQALRAMVAAVVEPAWVVNHVRKLLRLAQLAQDLEDPSVLSVIACRLGPSRIGFLAERIRALAHLLEAILARFDASPGQAALRGRTLLRRLAPLRPEEARCRDPQLAAESLHDPRPEVRLAAVGALAGRLQRRDNRECEDLIRELYGVLQGDADLSVRRRAARALGLADRTASPLDLSSTGRAALAAAVEARLALAADVAGRGRVPRDDLHGRQRAYAELWRLLQQC